MTDIRLQTSEQREGFAMVPESVIGIGLTPPELSVLVVLLLRMNRRTGRTEIGFALIAKLAEVSRATVKRVIPQLEARGLIRVGRVKRGTKNLLNTYTMLCRVGSQRAQSQSEPTQASELGSERPHDWAHSEPRTIGSIHKKALVHSDAQNVLDEGATAPPSNASKPRPKTAYSERFETWYLLYPRRENKMAAWRRYEDLRKSGDLPEPAELDELTKRFAVLSKDTEQRYIQHPATWLNAGGWQNEKLQGAVGAIVTPLDRHRSEAAERKRVWLEARGSSLEEYEARSTEPGWLDSLQIEGER